VIAGLALLPGCFPRKPPRHFDPELEDYRQVATEIEYPAGPPSPLDELCPRAPWTIRDSANIRYWDLTLMEAIHLALRNSRVLPDLRLTVLRTPEEVPTAFGPAVQESDPQFGVEAALSAFDAELSSSFSFEKNDRRYNNRFLGNQGIFQQDLGVFQTQIAKRAATGSQFIVRNYTDFDKNSNLGNQFRGGAWDVWYEGEVRHPLLQGSGLDFNRIAGPGARFGAFNGVLVARVRTDISLADFEAALRNLVSDVENAYWDLYFAYRDLDTKIRARDSAVATWRRVHALHLSGRRGGEAEKEAQAREQLFRFEEDVQTALAGTPQDGASQTAHFVPGVYTNERRLRLLIGLAANDDRLIRPADEPPISPVTFDWNTSAREALVEREELRRQRWEIKRRELELIASKNYLLPRLDVVGRYRFRGFGRHLLDPDSAGKPRFDNAYMDLMSGDFQEWQAGAEFSLPIGFRQAHAAVRNAELHVVQARAVLRQQEREVLHHLSDAVGEVDHAYTVLKTNINRNVAAQQQLEALQAAYDADKVEFYVLLDAQRRLADAEDRYYQSRVAYALALKSVYFEKGALLEYCGVRLAEGPSPAKAYVDAAEREHYSSAPRDIDYRLRPPLVISQGPAPQYSTWDVTDGASAGPSPFMPEAVNGPAGPPQPVQPPLRILPVPGVAPPVPAPQSQAALPGNQREPQAGRRPTTPSGETASGRPDAVPSLLMPAGAVNQADRRPPWWGNPGPRAAPGITEWPRPAVAPGPSDTSIPVPAVWPSTPSPSLPGSTPPPSILLPPGRDG